MRRHSKCKHTQDHMLLCKASTEEERNVFKTAQALHCNQVSTAEAWPQMHEKWMTRNSLSCTLTLRSSMECA